MRRTIDVIGGVLCGLALLGLCLSLVTAWRRHEMFYGTNYLGLDVGTFTATVVLGIAAIIGIVRLTQIALQARRTTRRARLGETDQP